MTQKNNEKIAILPKLPYTTLYINAINTKILPKILPKSYRIFVSVTTDMQPSALPYGYAKKVLALAYSYLYGYAKKVFALAENKQTYSL